MPRKLVRGGANMLGGRASRIEMRGLAMIELIEHFELIKFVNQGAVPSHYLSNNPNQQIKAYIQNYLQEEIKGEALVRNLQSFNQFLELVGITNAEEVNYANIARDVGVSAKTIKEYFQILIDTLIGTYLQPFFDRQKRSNILKSPKFYFFDNGIINYLKGINIKKEAGTEFGRAFEQAIYSEILNYKNYQGKNFAVSFWRTYEQNEVDFILGNAEIALEVKSTNNVQARDLKSLIKFKEIYQPKKAFIICNEKFPRLLKSGIEISPYMEFVKLLWTGKIL